MIPLYITVIKQSRSSQSAREISGHFSIPPLSFRDAARQEHVSEDRSAHSTNYHFILGTREGKQQYALIEDSEPPVELTFVCLDCRRKLKINRVVSNAITPDSSQKLVRRLNLRSFLGLCKFFFFEFFSLYFDFFLVCVE